jgi:hypothetical protein
VTDFCARCKFWEFISRRYGDAVGECRRHAPRPIQSVLVETAHKAGLAAWAIEEHAGIEHDDKGDYLSESAASFDVHEWPRTWAEAWCGEFEPAVGRTDLGKMREARSQRIDALEAWLLTSVSEEAVP